MECATIEKIAKLSGVIKPVIWNLWPLDRLGSVRPAIFAECRARALGRMPAADRGSLKAELRAYLRHLA